MLLKRLILDRVDVEEHALEGNEVRGNVTERYLDATFDQVTDAFEMHEMDRTMHVTIIPP